MERLYLHKWSVDIKLFLESKTYSVVKSIKSIANIIMWVNPLLYDAYRINGPELKVTRVVGSNMSAMVERKVVDRSFCCYFE